MDRDQYIISVYCLVCEQYAAVVPAAGLRQGGFAPALSDEEVITLEICGELFGLHHDTAIWRYFRQHYQAWFPHLRDRTLFVRQAANLWQVKAAIQQRLTVLSTQAQDAVQVIDTMPLPVCGYTRARRDRCFRPDADYGYCAAKQLSYYGFKLGLRIARSGMILACLLLPARPHDVQFLDALSDGASHIVVGDKGFIDQVRQTLLAERHAVTLITPPRPNMPSSWSQAVLHTSARIRKRIETVHAHLTDFWAVTRSRTHDLWHLQHRLIRKVLAHTVGVFFNLARNRPPLDLDGLLACA
jgi:hypothetical protein